MKILFSHNNFPAQFRRLAPAVSEQGHDVVFLAKNREWHAQLPCWRQGLENIKRIVMVEEKFCIHICVVLNPVFCMDRPYIVHASSSSKGAGNLTGLSIMWVSEMVFTSATHFQTHVELDCLSGTTTPEAPTLTSSPRTSEPDRALRLRTWNAQTLLEIADCHCGVVPTQWQLDQFPEHLRSRLRVIHEGIDVSVLANLKTSNRSRPSCLPDDPKVEVLTYVSRGFEPYRGFPEAMQAIALLQAERPISMY